MSKTRGIFEKVTGSGQWWIRYSDATGKIRREKAGTKAQARSLYQLRKADALMGKKLPANLRVRPTSFAQLATDALEYSRIHKRSVDDDVERMRLLVEWFGSHAADSITPQQIERRLRAAQQDRKWAPATVNRYKALLSLVYRIALDNGKVSANPARLVRRLREDNGVVRHLHENEQERLKAALQPRHPERWATVLFALNTGLRASEQFGLTWTDVDLERGQLRLAKTKNGTSRYVDLNAAARSALEAMKTWSPDSSAVFPTAPYRMWFAIALSAAEIKDFSWHCLRHTFASRLVMAGVDLRTVAALMGHKSLQMTMRYAHLAAEHTAAAVAKLDRFYEPTDTKTDTEISAALRMRAVKIMKVAVGQ